MKVNIARDIRERRKELGLSQRDFVKLFNYSAPRKLRTSQYQLSRYENNVQTPPADVYAKFISLKNRKRG